MPLFGQGASLAVMFIDLDRFKEINEARGLAVGDALLKEVAERFSSLLHEDDLLARLDSDEFAVLLSVLFKLLQVFLGKRYIKFGLRGLLHEHHRVRLVCLVKNGL